MSIQEIFASAPRAQDSTASQLAHLQSEVDHLRKLIFIVLWSTLATFAVALAAAVCSFYVAYYTHAVVEGLRQFAEEVQRGFN